MPGYIYCTVVIHVFCLIPSTIFKMITKENNETQDILCAAHMI